MGNDSLQKVTIILLTILVFVGITYFAMHQHKSHGGHSYESAEDYQSDKASGFKNAL